MNQVLEGFQLASQQSRLWAAQKGAPRWSHCIVEISGQLQVNRLEQALQALVERHEMLRTVFQRLPGRKVVIQRITEAASLNWQVHDLRDTDHGALKALVTEILATNPPQPLDGSAGSLLNADLILSTTTAYLILRLPTLCADVTTLHLMVEDLCLAYQHTTSDDEIVQYIQFSEWQHELLGEEEETAPARAFWQQQIPTGVTELGFPFERKSTADKPSYVTQTWDLPTTLVQAVRTLAQKEETSEAAILQAAWATLLAQLCGQESFLIGVWSKGRVHEELAATYGPIDRYLPLGWSVAGAYTLPMLARRLETQHEAATEWQDLAALAEQAPIVGFAYHDAPKRFDAGELSFVIRELQAIDEAFKLALTCISSEQTIECSLLWNSQIFQADDVRFYPERFQKLLTQGVQHSQKSVLSLGWLGELEQTHIQQLCAVQNQPAPAISTMHQWIGQQAQQTPDALAIQFGDEHLTYRMLDAYSNQLARVLQRYGVGHEQIVGIRMERSLEMIVALLAIWKAGAAYVPLDLGLPSQRLLAMQEDAQPALLLTHPALIEQLDSLECPILTLDQHWGLFAAESDAPLDLDVQAEQLAYVMFTSGSTGRPKGVAIEHRQLINYTATMIERLAAKPGHHYGLISTFAADLGYTMIFPALCSGGCLRLIPQALSTDADGLAAYLQQAPIDYLKIVPSHLRALLSSVHPEHILPQRCLVLGGEGTSWELVQRIQTLAPSCGILNHYGPTETTVGVLTHRINPTHSQRTRTLPLSQAVANTTILVLDQQFQQVPLGMPGEVFIGGAAVGRGYLGQPEQTAAAFLNDLAIAPSAGRLYKTGDLARLWPDGNLEILGRSDDQVKYHGYRVELNELRHQLNLHPSIHDSVVTLIRGDEQVERLVAYYVASQELDLGVLRAWLAQSVINEVLPNTFIRLERLPLTANGKIDRQSLPTPDSIRQQQASFVAPRTAEEGLLATIWAEVLNLPQVGIHDSFFTLGGDSILGIQVVARANQAGLRLNPKDLFQYQTIADLAAVALSHSDGTESQQIDQGLVKGVAPLTPIQHWFFSQTHSRPEDWTVSVWLELEETVQPDLIKQVLERLLDHHDALRTAFPLQAGQRQAVWTEHRSSLAWTSVDYSALPANEHQAAVEQLVAKQQTALDLITGHLFQALYVDYGSSRPAQLILMVHRLIIDGFSWRILLEQFAQAYAQLAVGKDLQLPNKTTAFKDWAESLAAYAQSKAVLATVDFWQAQVQTAATMAVPLDYPKPTVWSLDTGIVEQLSIEETHTLLHKVPNAYQTTISDVLLAALAQTLSGWLGSDTIVVDLEHHGRTTPDERISLDQTVGWFTALYPAKLQFPANANPGMILKSIKEQIRQIPQQGMSYGVLRYLGSDAIKAKLGTAESPFHFRYAGQFNIQATMPFTPTDQREPIVPTSHYLLGVNSAVINDRLEISWWYSPELHIPVTVAALSQHYMASLRTLIAHCLAAETGGFTPSDFPLLEIDQQGLDALLKNLGS